MRILLLTLCFFLAICSVAESTPPAEHINEAFAAQCLALAGQNNNARQTLSNHILHGLNQQQLEALAVLVASDKSESAAWLNNRIRLMLKTLPYDLAVDGRFEQRDHRGRFYIFKTFNDEKLTVVKNRATMDDCAALNSTLQSAARLFLKKTDNEYFIVWCKSLLENDNFFPLPNPEGRYMLDMKKIHF